MTCGVPIDLTLTVNYTGGPSPRILTLSVPSGPPPVIITTTLDSSAPQGASGITTATGNQTGRIFRDGVPSTCGTTKAFPGFGDTSGTRRFDSYTFNSCRNTCTQVDVTSNNNVNLFTAAYSPSFSSGNIQTNYIGDAGLSGTPMSYGIDTLGGQSYAVVVHEVPPGGGVGTQYTVQISGCAVSCDFNVPATLPPITVTAGDSGSQTFTITPVSSIDVPVTFSCTGLPAHASCAFSPSSVTPGSSTKDVQVTISTEAPTMARSNHASPLYAAWLPFGLLVVTGVGSRRNRKLYTMLGVMLLILLLTMLVGCGSSSNNSPPPPPPGTPTGTYTVTVNSTSTGSAVHHSTLTLTVQ
jgi:hypothetical protein